MVAPTSLVNSDGQNLDPVVDSTGTALYKLGVGATDAAGLDQDATWQGVATHERGATPGANDGVVVVAGYDADGDAVIPLAASTSGKLIASAGKLAHGGKQMTGGARVAITGTTTPCAGVLVKAYTDNGSTVWVGGLSVTADKASTGGYPLEPGDAVGVPCENATEVYIIGSGTDGVAWIASAD